MSTTITQLHGCRLCGQQNLRRFLHLDQMPLTDGFVAETTLGSEFLAPLDIYWCPECRSAQTQHDVSVDDYYREYRYNVSHSGFARRFMDLLAEATFQRFGLQAGDRVIEVGSSDGSQLACFQRRGARVLGFEPSSELVPLSRAAGVPVVQALFGSQSNELIPQEMQPAQVVLLTYTFDHLPDPRTFLQDVRKVLDPERGVLLIEVHDLEKILERRETCLLAHEHATYLTALSMQRLLAREGFRLVSTEVVPEAQRRGNSLLVAAVLEESRHTADPSADCSHLAWSDDWEVYAGFGQAVQQSCERLRSHVQSILARGERVAGYGAGGRGVMTLAMADLDRKLVSYLCDQNESFYGLYCPKSHVPVVAPAQLLSDPVQEVIVFSFGYFAEIQASLHEFCRRGGRLTNLLDIL